MPIVVKTVVPPFFDRFSPFPTVFPADLNRDSFDKSGVAPFRISATPSENGENRKNGEPAKDPSLEGHQPKSIERSSGGLAQESLELGDAACVFFRGGSPGFADW